MISGVSLQKIGMIPHFSVFKHDTHSTKMMIAHNYYLWHFLKDPRQHFSLVVKMMTLTESGCSTRLRYWKLNFRVMIFFFFTQNVGILQQQMLFHLQILLQFSKFDLESNDKAITSSQATHLKLTPQKTHIANIVCNNGDYSFHSMSVCCNSG